MTEDRLDRVERIISSLAESLQVNAQRHEADYERLKSEQMDLKAFQEANAQQIAENTRGLADLRQRHEADHERLRAEQAELRDQRERDEQDWREDRATMQRAITALVEIAQVTFARVDATIARIDQMQDEVTTLQGQTQDTINQVRDLQVQGNRIMERLERLDGAG